MICRFCAQWNADSAARCCFCGNTAAATEDATASGRLTAAQRGLARLGDEPGAARGGASQHDPTDHWQKGEVRVAKVILAVLAGVLALLWMLGKLSRC